MRHRCSLAPLAAALALLAASPPAQEVGTPALSGQVDPRVELMSTIFRLSGAREYNQPGARSPYSQAVDAHFGPFRDHPVVRAARSLRARCGISYDAVMSMAVHLEDTRTLQERTPFDQKPERLDGRWTVGDARDFLEKAREFVADTHFNDFQAQQKELFRAASERMTAFLARRGYVEWFDAFHGSRPQARFQVIIGMLNGPCNYGCSVVLPGGEEEICPVIGASHFDEEGVPTFDDSVAGTVVHELCHPYTNPLVDSHADQLENAGRRIFAHCRETMEAQAYSNWQTMLRETLVRACVVRYLRAADGDAAAAAEIQRQRGRGFRWVGDVAAALGDYEKDREQYPDLASFMPRLAQVLETCADQVEEQASRAPRVVSMTPENGDTDVDPALKEIRVVFDRPMRDQSWSVVGGGEHFPETTGPCRYDEERKVFILPVGLRPEWEYQFWLNRGQYASFVSEEGYPLESVAVTFRTGKGR